MADLELTTVPRDLYYHEVAYVRGLEAALKFYAEPKNYEQFYVASKGFSVAEVLCDNGRQAIAALRSTHAETAAGK